MKPLEDLLRNAARSRRRIALSEGSDPRVVAAAVQAQAEGIAEVILIGAMGDMQARLAEAGTSDDHGIELRDPETCPDLAKLTALYHSLRQKKGVTLSEARAATIQPHVYATLLVKSGMADGTVGGAVATTTDIVRAALQVIGPAPGTTLVSSFFLMLFCEKHHVKKGAYIFADSGLVVNPTAAEMAQIAMSSAASLAQLTMETPRVAMLSFSTRGSAQHDKVSKVVAATDVARRQDPDLLIDGELQFDAAFVPDVAASKAEGSPLRGEANIFVFPNLESGNIAYKIAQRMAGATAIGPVLQGLDKPANDLSRGCSAEDIVHMIAVTAAQVPD